MSDDLNGTASRVGRVLAETIVANTMRITDRAVNVLLDRTGERLARIFIEWGASETEITHALDIFAETFEARLNALERALQGDGGSA